MSAVTLYRGALGLTPVVVYTVPAGKVVTVRDLVFSNSVGFGASAVTVRLDGVDLVSAVTVSAGGVLTVSPGQALAAGGTITAFTNNSGVNLYAGGDLVTI